MQTTRFTRLPGRIGRIKGILCPATSPSAPRRRPPHILRLALALASLVVMMLVLMTPATASTTQTYHATFVEVGGVIPGVRSCGSATISRFGHVAFQCVVFNKCGPNCEERTLTFDDGSTLVIHESIVDMISPGHSAGFLEIRQTIVGGTGRFEGATGSGTGMVNLDAFAVIIASGTITLP